MIIVTCCRYFLIINLTSLTDTSVDFKKYIRRKKLSYANLVGSEMPQLRETQEVSLFNDLDRDGSGSLEWWEFAPAMSLRFLSRRKPVITWLL